VANFFSLLRKWKEKKPTFLFHIFDVFWRRKLVKREEEEEEEEEMFF